MQKYEKMVVIFIDLLGTKNNTGFKEKYSIHQLFHNEVRLNEKRQENLSHVIYDRKIYSFSDCAYIFYFYKEGIEEERKNTEKLVQIALYNTSLSLLKIMNQGYLIRGGATFGDAYFDDLGFFGPAVEEAYELEANVALYPRIILSEKIGKSVYEMEQKEQSVEICEILFGQVFYMFYKEDEKYYLNTFYQLQKNDVLVMDDGTNLSIEDVKHNLLCTINRDLVLYNSDERIKSKLLWMKDFMNTIKFSVNDDVVKGSVGWIPKNIV